MSYPILNPLEVPDWNEQVLTFQDVSIFHSAEWAAVLMETYGYQPFYAVRWEQGGLKGVIPVLEVNSRLTGRRGVSLPFTDFCPPLIGDTEIFPVLFQMLTRLGVKRGWKYIELRGDEIPEEDPAGGCYYRHHLLLEGPSETWFKKLKENHRRNVLRAEKEGVQVNILHSEEAVTEFCRLNTMTRRVHGLPPQPRRFFEQLFERIISRGLGFVALADFQGKKVAGSVFLRFGDRAVYKFGASDPKVKNLGANHLVMWKVIQMLADQGCREVDFGRTDFDQEGLRRFKAGWGAKESRIGYRRYDLKSEVFQGISKGKAHLSEKVFSRLPHPLLTLIGRLAYRHMG